MKNVVIKNITAKADELANLYWKTKEERYKILWYQEIKKQSHRIEQAKSELIQQDCNKIL